MHPERAERIRAIESELERRDWLGWERREAPEADLARVEAVHPSAHVEAVREMSARGGAFDLDTPTSTGSWDAALRAAGGACAMVDALLSGEAERAFAALRPPGHHAEVAQAMGFCLFNNVAIAARHARDVHGAERVLVLDWDVHHGNGTNAIFGGSRDVLFASLHQWPFYPGTGELSDVGAGEGEGFSLNLPLPAGSDEEMWLSLLEHVVMPAAREFDPDLVLISAGYDAHRDDPIGDCLLDAGSYQEMTKHLNALGKPLGAVLEGGYDLGALASSVAATMETLADGGEARSVGRGPLTDGVAERLRRYWPV